MRLVLSLLLISLTAAAQVNTGKTSDTAAQQIRRAQRLLVVTTPAWDAVDGTMQRFERQSGAWTKVGDAVPIVVGKSGMGWDRKLLEAQSSSQGWNGPIKKEGDGRSPAGVLEVGVAFGFAEQGPTARKYIPLTSATECVDDVKSEHYAHIVERNQVPNVDWNSSEKMRDIDVYKLGMVVNHNLAKTVPGNGSCIFLHIWKGPGRGTAGCTAMDEAQLSELVQWLSDKDTVLVQMPAGEYARLKTRWKLP